MVLHVQEYLKLVLFLKVNIVQAKLHLKEIQESIFGTETRETEEICHPKQGAETGSRCDEEAFPSQAGSSGQFCIQDAKTCMKC